MRHIEPCGAKFTPPAWTSYLLRVPHAARVECTKCSPIWLGLYKEAGLLVIELRPGSRRELQVRALAVCLDPGLSRVHIPVATRDMSVLSKLLFLCRGSDPTPRMAQGIVAIHSKGRAMPTPWARMGLIQFPSRFAAGRT